MDKLSFFTQILAVKPHDTFTRYAYGMELVARGRTEEGLAEFDHLIETQPDYVPAYQIAAETLVKINRTGPALEKLEAGIAAAARTGNRKAFADLQTMYNDLH